MEMFVALVWRLLRRILACCHTLCMLSWLALVRLCLDAGDVLFEMKLFVPCASPIEASTCSLTYSQGHISGMLSPRFTVVVGAGDGGVLR